MSNKSDKQSPDESERDDMLPEYDLSKARRSKYPQMMREGYTITVRHADGSVTRTLYLAPLVHGWTGSEGREGSLNTWDKWQEWKTVSPSAGAGSSDTTSTPAKAT